VASRPRGDASSPRESASGVHTDRSVLASDPAEAPRDPAERPLQSAIEVFNTGEYPRRVASLTRSLGTPEVTVRPGEAVASSIVIVIAWELCWYTYEVDLDDMQGPEAQALAQGTELSELGAEDRLANARADRARRARVDLIAVSPEPPPARARGGREPPSAAAVQG